MKRLQLADPVRLPHMTTAELRETFLLEGLFQLEGFSLAYDDLDRTVIGGAVLTLKPLSLETSPESRAEYFCERQELGVLSVDGSGTVTADDERFALNKLDCLSIGRGSKSVTFASSDPQSSATHHLPSYPAYRVLRTSLVRFRDPEPLELSAIETCNKRTIHKTIFRDGIQSCQFPIGPTRLQPPSNWNTMPSHTHIHHSELLLRCGPLISRTALDGTSGRHSPPLDR